MGGEEGWRRLPPRCLPLVLPAVKGLGWVWPGVLAMAWPATGVRRWGGGCMLLAWREVLVVAKRWEEGRA